MSSLFVHVKTEVITDDVLKAFFSRVVGSSWSTPTEVSREDYMAAAQKIITSPREFICSGDLYELNTAIRLMRLIGEKPVLVDEYLIKEVCRLAEKNQIRQSAAEFIKKNAGNMVFSVAW